LRQLGFERELSLLPGRNATQGTPGTLVVGQFIDPEGNVIGVAETE
jgi:hypothetical protein